MKQARVRCTCLQVRNKLWRALLKWGASQESAAFMSLRSQGLRQRIYVLLNAQTSSFAAAAVAFVINLAIITSSLSFIYSSLPEVRTATAWQPAIVQQVTRGTFRTMCCNVLYVCCCLCASQCALKLSCIDGMKPLMA